MFIAETLYLRQQPPYSMLHGAWARDYHAGDFLVAVSHQAMTYQYIKATTYYTGTWPSSKTSFRHCPQRLNEWIHPSTSAVWALFLAMWPILLNSKQLLATKGKLSISLLSVVTGICKVSNDNRRSDLSSDSSKFLTIWFFIRFFQVIRVWIFVSRINFCWGIIHLDPFKFFSISFSRFRDSWSLWWHCVWEISLIAIYMIPCYFYDLLDCESLSPTDSGTMHESSSFVENHAI